MTKTYTITGMHCPACALTVKKALSSVPGVNAATVNLAAGTAKLRFDGAEPAEEALAQAVAEAGYELAPADSSDGASANASDAAAPGPAGRVPGRAGRALRDWLVGGLGAGAFMFLYLLLQRTGIIESFSPNTTELSPYLGLVTGLVASVSTCFALVGSFVLALGQTARRSEHPLRNAFKSTGLFHLGRLAAFTAFGALLGLVGGSLRLSGTALGWYTIAAAVAIGLSGLSILGLRLPLFSGARVAATMERLSLSGAPASAAGLGALTFFLPCGFTLSMQAIALASRNPLTGALALGSFALGTLPVLFAAGLGSSYIGGKRLPSLRIASGFLIIAFACITAVSGFSLSRFSGDLIAQSTQKTAEAPKGTQTATQESTADAAQVVEMHITYQGFEPSTLMIEAGRPVEWVIWGDEVTGCTNRIIIPSLGIQKAIRPGKNVVSFTATETGNLRFSCWMGMVRGVFVVQ